MSDLVCVLELLEPASWELASERIASERRAGVEVEAYFVEATEEGLKEAGGAAQRLDFRLIDVRDAKGDLARLRIPWVDFFEVQEDIVRSAEFRRVPPRDRLVPYLARETVAFDQYTGLNVWPGLFLAAVVAWKAGPDRRRVLYLRRRVWQEAICRYGERLGVEILPVGGVAASRKGAVLSLAGPLAGALRAARLVVWQLLHPPRESGPLPTAPSAGRPTIACEYYGQLNLDRPELHSDLFWWQRSEIPADGVTVAFRLVEDPLDAEKGAQLASHGMLAVPLDPRARTLRGVPVFHHLKPDLSAGPRVRGSDPESVWLRQHVSKYSAVRAYWRDLFISKGICAWVTWYKYSAEQAAIADAAAEADAITAIYQRAYEESSSPETATFADVLFAFGTEQTAVEIGSGSDIGHVVVTGYLGDHRFELLRPHAAELRTRVLSAGASKVAAFFDEGSAQDERWHTGHGFMRTNYEFLLRRVLEEPWFGLILKPKVAFSLRERLGDVAGLLEDAEATGRCVLLGSGRLQNAYPPAFAALASDVAIHGHTIAATAAIEAALAGVPTVMLDREGWSASRFHAMDGSVTFSDWPELWSALSDHWLHGGVEGLGEWGGELDRIDPFRDGRAAERMGAFLGWYLEEKRQGSDRDAALRHAVERYVTKWGDWTIVSARASRSGNGASLS